MGLVLFDRYVDDNRRSAPPALFWLIPTTVVILRFVPFFLTRVLVPPAGTVLPAVGYNPIDWFAYVAFIRQCAETGDWVLSNPYATFPDRGRFILPLFSLLGHISRLTGLDVFWSLELSRVPLIFLFFRVLWWFLHPLIPDTKARFRAVFLVGFSGGIEALALPIVAKWPADLQKVAYQALSDDQGWNTFAALYNPMWIAGLSCTLVSLRPVIQPGGPRSSFQWGQTALGYVLTHLIHPYSGLVVLGVIMSVPVLHILLGVRNNVARYLLGMAKAIVPALTVIGIVALWQRRDPAFRSTMSRVFGNNPLSVFWYPVTLGAVMVVAIRGWREWVAKQVPARIEVGAWTLTVVFMHSSPLFNGHHYVFHLHLPVCVVAACAFESVYQLAKSSTYPRQFFAALLIAALFQSPLAVTFRAIKQVVNYQVPEPAMRVLEYLSKLPRGTVYTSPHLGTLVPAYTPHRTYLGHWFLTPDYAARQAKFNEMVEGRLDPSEAIALWQKEGIDYVLLPPTTSPKLLLALAQVAKETFNLERYTLARLR